MFTHKTHQNCTFYGQILLWFNFFSAHLGLLTWLFFLFLFQTTAYQIGTGSPVQEMGYIEHRTLTGLPDPPV